MKVEQISSVGFGVRPELKVSKKHTKLFNEIADRLEKYNRKIKRKPNEIGYYEIIQNGNGLTFTEYKDGWEHKIKLGRKI